MFRGDLTPSDAAGQLESRRRPGALVRDAKGDVQFWIQHGRLVKYAVSIQGTIEDDGEDRSASRISTTEIVGLGASVPVLPSAATVALGRPVPEPQPRLSDEVAEQILVKHGKRNIGVHDPSSIVKCGDEYWMFSTGTGITSWRSSDLDQWRRGPRVLPNVPGWVVDLVPSHRGHFWAPDVIKRDGRYLLYYSVSSFGSNTSAIAMLSSPTLDPDDPAFHWTDHGMVLRSSRANDYNAIDPAIIETGAGELWMSFGSFWSGLKLCQLDPKTGMQIDGETKLHAIANYGEIEAPHLYFHNGYYYLFVNWGKCCRGVESTYEIRVGRSRDLTGPYMDKTGVKLADGGGTPFLSSEGPFIGPGHANVFKDGSGYLLSCHYYDATERGRSMLSLRPMTWSAGGWPALSASDSPAAQ